jgi:hypothetical protein
MWSTATAYLVVAGPGFKIATRKLATLVSLRFPLSLQPNSPIEKQIFLCPSSRIHQQKSKFSSVPPAKFTYRNANFHLSLQPNSPTEKQIFLCPSSQIHQQKCILGNNRLLTAYISVPPYTRIQPLLLQIAILWDMRRNR